MGTKKWTAVEYDAAKYLETQMRGELQFVTLPKVMLLQVVIEMDDALYKDIAKNPSTLAKLQQAAGDKARKAMGDAMKKIVAAEAKAAKFNKAAAAAFARDLQSTLEADFQKASDAMADEAVEVIEAYRKGKSELLAFRIKSVGKIAVNAITMTGGIVLSVATAGALSPVGIIGVVRTSVGIVQEGLKLASTADKMALLIQGELAVLRKIMKEEVAKAKTSGKIAQGVKEVGLNLLSKAVGLETPSLKNCQSHIDLHNINISKLEKESKKLSVTIYDAMDEQEKLAKALKTAKATLPADKVGKAALALEKSEKALDKLLQATIAVNERVEVAHERGKLFQKALDGMKDGIPEWLKYVDTACGLAADLAMAITDSSDAASAALASVLTLEATIGSEIIDRL